MEPQLSWHLRHSKLVLWTVFYLLACLEKIMLRVGESFGGGPEFNLGESGHICQGGRVLSRRV